MCFLSAHAEPRLGRINYGEGRPAGAEEVGLLGWQQHHKGWRWGFPLNSMKFGDFEGETVTSSGFRLQWFSLSPPPERYRELQWPGNPTTFLFVGWFVGAIMKHSGVYNKKKTCKHPNLNRWFKVFSWKRKQIFLPAVDRDGSVLSKLLLGFMHLADEVDEALPRFGYALFRPVGELELPHCSGLAILETQPDAGG